MGLVESDTEYESRRCVLFRLLLFDMNGTKQALMGSIESGTHIICVLIFFIILSSTMAQSNDRASLEALFHSYANKTVSKHRTGDVFNISLPSNFTNVQLSVLRIRSWTLWSKGESLGFFQIPEGALTKPYSKRVVLVYENLGNLSSQYYNVVNHSLIAPVVGFIAYDASKLTLNNEKLEFYMNADPISITFSSIDLQGQNVTPKCVKFGDDGSVEFSNMTNYNVCRTQSAGRFSVVVPTPPYTPDETSNKHSNMLVIVLVAALCGFILLGLVFVFVVSAVAKKRKIREMESESEKGVAFETFWVGRSRLPSASMIRTQPVLEHDYVP